jgi:signal transduction histidine kinase
MAAFVAAHATFPEVGRRSGRELGVGVAVGCALALSFVVAPIPATPLGAMWLESVARVLAVAIPVAVGIYAWRSTTFALLGTLLVGAGIIWLVASFALTDRMLVHSVGRIAIWIGWAVLLYLMLAFPGGQIRSRIDRRLVLAIISLVVTLYLPTALLAENYPTPTEWVTCAKACPHNAFMVLSHEPGVISKFVVPLRDLLTVLLFVAVIARLSARIARASSVRRRTLTPVLAVAAAGVTITCLGLGVRRVDAGSHILDVVTWLMAFALPAVALAFLAGLVRWRLYVANSLSRFASSLSSLAGTDAVRAAFADAFEDPALAIVYPVGHNRWAAADGQPAQPPSASAGRAVTELHDGSGHVVAALVHDEALQDERAFINAVASYATLTLENEHLAADVAHLAHEIRETQARAAASADRTRQEIERDLHDGAQQRLIALQIKLELAAQRPGADVAGADELKRLGAEVQLVMNDLRALARGVFTPVLTDLGPVAALREAVRDAPIRTSIVVGKLGRYSAEVERAVYFCCLEALQNAYKHAHDAGFVRITFLQRRYTLAFQVSDDGGGFDANVAHSGAGLHNMHDRLAAVGGSLDIDSSRGSGTRVSGTIPGSPVAN